MKVKDRKYRAVISSDWNECLAPSAPFDPITFNYPSLDPEVKEIFKKYTGNRIPLSEATRRIATLLPQMITEDQMDAYLDASFATYRGMPELIEWCSENDILFMINTTGMQGYFQRVAAKGLLTAVPIISASPAIRYPVRDTDPAFYDLIEIQDKASNTEAVMKRFGIPPGRVILMGESGGDGPHFEWGARAGAFLVGSMTKSSLDQYCRQRWIKINLYFGLRYSEGEKRKEEQERQVNFMDLIPRIAAIL